MDNENKPYHDIENMHNAHEAEIETKIGRSMKEFGTIGLVLLLYVVLFIASFLLLKKVFLAGIITMIILILVGVIALGIYIEREAKKKKTKK